SWISISYRGSSKLLIHEMHQQVNKSHHYDLVVLLLVQPQVALQELLQAVPLPQPVRRHHLLHGRSEVLVRVLRRHCHRYALVVEGVPRRLCRHCRRRRRLACGWRNVWGALLGFGLLQYGLCRARREEEPAGTEGTARRGGRRGHGGELFLVGEGGGRGTATEGREEVSFPEGLGFGLLNADGADGFEAGDGSLEMFEGGLEGFH
ncbi:unnamed protein product, partial [Musa hybrid cultivar]